MAKAVLYARFSPRPRAEVCESAVRQLERGRAYCLAHSYGIVAELKDEDASGGDAEREGLQEAIGLAVKHKAVLVVTALDRLARNTFDALDILNKLIKGKADLASLQESFNTRSAMGKFVYTVLVAFAELQRNNIREATSRGMRRHMARGRRMGRVDRCPYGWMVDESGPKVRDSETGELTDRPANMIENPEEQKAIAFVQRLRQEGQGYRAICNELASYGFPPRDKAWHPATVLKILRRYPIATHAQ